VGQTCGFCGCFGRRLKFEFHYSRVTSDTGLLAYRKLGEVLGLTTLAGDIISDSRTGKNGWRGIIGLLRQSAYGCLAALAGLSGIWIDQVHEQKPPKIIVLDMDSPVSQTYGDQEGVAYNGHFGCTCYHPLFVLNQFGDLERGCR